MNKEWEMSRVRGGFRRIVGTLTTVCVAVLGLVALPAAQAAADQLPYPAPMQERTAGTVSADPLPTVQIDSGVVYTQAIVGNTVYVGGSFSNARPAGAAAGTNLVPRSNLLAFDLITGQLVQSWAPQVNGTVRVVRASPDGSRIYVGGSFTVANGTGETTGSARFNLATFSATTGALLTAFKPAVGGSYVNAIAATSSTVYVGGLVSAGNGVARQNLMAFDASNGSLLAWAPTTDLQVDTMVLTPSADKVVVGGRFALVNAVSQRGLVALDPTDGSILPWVAPSVVKNGWNQSPYVGKAGIYSLQLSHDGTSVYGTGWVYATAAVGNLEGTFRAASTTGDIQWIADCHGDTYGAYDDGQDNVYIINHNHDCETVGGYPQAYPSPGNLRHSQVLSSEVMGTLSRSPRVSSTYADWSGRPAPAMRNWFPDWTTGSATGQGQAGWTVDGKGDYVVIAGEFPYVNGQVQQGIVRFARENVVTPKQGPRLSGTRWVPTVISPAPGAIKFSIPENWDRDDMSLTYDFRRNGVSTPLATVQTSSTFWDREPLVFTDSGLTPGASYTYRVIARDPDGNVANSNSVSVTVASQGLDSYGQAVVDDGASLFYRLGAPSTAGIDWAGGNNGVLGTGVTAASSGAVAGGDGRGSAFDGTTNGRVATGLKAPVGEAFTAELWMRTTTTRGGKLIGYGFAPSGSSTVYDRHVYMRNDGRLTFGVNPGSVKTVTSTAAYNDGQWHHVVASLGAKGVSLFVDGALVGTDSSVTSAQSYLGYWRIGGDAVGSSWPSRPTSAYFAGEIDEVAVYPTQLSRATVREHFTLSGRTLAQEVPEAPEDAYGAAVYNGEPSLFWRLDDASGSTTAADSADLLTPGTVRGVVEFGQTGALTAGTAAQFDGSTGYVVSSKSATNPSRYTVSAWFKTTSDRGGKIIGFGNASTGLSSSYDRHVYMRDDGTLVFGAYTGSQVTITSPAAYNDGAWHQMVATQGADGMKLYVDGALVGSNTNTVSQSYTGYWRVGGDRTWSGATSSYFAGVIDEVAVYPVVVPAQDVATLYQLGANGVPPHVDPTAVIGSTADGLTVQFDGTQSVVHDGATVTSYAWDLGDGTTSSEAQPVHTYAASGDYPVTLVVTDDQGGESDAAQSVVSVTHAAPVAAFTTAVTELDVSVDAASSSATDGATLEYDWSWGDASAHDSGVSAQHTYTGAGDYEIVLTVTDSFGLTSTTSTTVTVAAATVLASDAFSTDVTAGWGTADVGGRWNGAAATTGLSVAAGQGLQTLTVARQTRTALLTDLAAQNIDATFDVSMSQVANGGGAHLNVIARQTAGGQYRIKLRMSSTGTITVNLAKLVGTTETLWTSRALPGTYQPGQALSVRIQAVTSGTTTALAGKVWAALETEPTTWLVTQSDSESALQAAGPFGISTYLTGTVTNVTVGTPLTVAVDNVSIVEP